jgi:hypothetical protein
MEKLLIIFLCLIGIYAIWRNKLPNLKSVLGSKSSKVLKNPENRLNVQPNPTSSITPVLTNPPSDAMGYDKTSDVYSSKMWELKPQFDDIYNYEDQGGLDITHALDKNPAITIVYENAPKSIKTPTQVEDITLEDVASNELKEYQPEGTLEYLKPEEMLKPTLAKFKTPKIIKDGGVTYKLLGSATNDHYSQNFLIYESPEITDPTTLKNVSPTLKENMEWMKSKIMSYVLVTLHEDKINIIHRIAPRNKVEIGDVVYMSMGNFEIGPLQISRYQ